MTSLLDSLNQPVVLGIGWALLNFLWQGLLLGVAWASLRHVLRRHRPNIRYAAACLVLLLMAAAPVVTFSFLLHRASAATAASGLPVNRSESARLPLGTPGDSWMPSVPGPLIDRLTVALEAALPWLVGLWGTGVCLLSWRLVRGGWSAHRLRLLQTTPVTTEWIERLRKLQHRMRVSQPVRLLQSALVEVPTVAGWFRPVILLPASTLTGLSVAQLELILAHELAHIRRCDPWVNLLQVLVETVLFYHPAVWWVSRCIREERELCCDDLAVQACGDRLAYAQALTLLETLRGPATTAALAASGGSLLQRIRHVLGLPGTPLASSWRRRTGNTLVGVGAGLFVLGIVWLAMSPKQYEAIARVVVSRSDGAPLALGAAGGDVSDPYQVLTEASRPQTSAVLTEVVARLNLAMRWADPGEATPLASQEAVARLRKRIHIRVVENTDLVEIRACSSAKDKPAEEAAEIANKIAEVYVESRSRLDQESARRGIKALELTLEQQNDEVRKAQAKVDELRKELISEISAFEEAMTSTLDPETVRQLKAQRIRAQANYNAIAEAELLETLKVLRSAKDDRRLREVALNATPDEELASLLQTLWAKEANFAKLSASHGGEHPEVRSEAAMIADLDNKVNAKIEGIIAGLEVRVAANQKEVTTLKNYVEAAKRDDADKTEQARSYFVAKRDLEHQQKIREAILMRVLNETVNAAIPKPPIVEIVDPATPPIKGRYPGHRTGLSLCSLGALCSLLGLVLRVSASTGPAVA